MSPLRRITIVAFALLAAAAAIGAAYQAIATARDEARFPMPGRRIDVGGRFAQARSHSRQPTHMELS